MNRIFVEAKSEATPECRFLQALISRHFPGCECKIICMNGFGNLFKEAIPNQLRSAHDEGDNVVVILDADTPQKQGGYAARQQWVNAGLEASGLTVPCFLYPDNHGDGDVECLMEAIARRDVHKAWFDCFEDYEACISGVKASDGTRLYNTPNRKGKLHTYITSMPLISKQRNKVGSGEWLFSDTRYWDLASEALRPLLDFFETHLL